MKTLTLGVDVQVNSKAFKDLQKSLHDTIGDLQGMSKQDPLNKSLAQAVENANKLEQVLNGAWDSKLNRLDMSKFNLGLKSAGISAEQVKTTLGGYSTTYEKFNRVVLEGNTQLKQTNKLLDKMAITMANTIRFGISSRIFNGLTSSLQKAYDYTLKLDKSLNDIRIVSDASSESMVKFAKYANESAKKLGASTLDYTKGALIYYQQGLSEDEVIKRTDTTIKMSNVLGRSTEEVSNYMTAIWNNFAKGTDNLEYYGDVITALGAKTASSAEEIAGGLEKFAAIGKTIGLSYEYATAALTTITATTRQSEDTVGNALKTIFARIQGLKLGETLEDGTSLNKYSEALAKVGISIKDESGELKEMDTILNELGKTWGTLTNAQKAALAQTVAGVRQYNQLIALMDNWGFFQENLETAYGSTGTLAQQQDIYLDSLEAHLNKLQTEWEKTYDIIFDEETIKSFADTFTKLLSGVNTWLNSLGGGMSSLLNIGIQLANVFSNQIGGEIARELANSAKSVEEALKQSIFDAGFKPETQAYEKVLNISKQIAGVKKELNNEEYQSLAENMILIGQYEDKLEEINQLKEQSLQDMAQIDAGEFENQEGGSVFDRLKKGQGIVEDYQTALSIISDKIQLLPKETEEEIQKVEKLQQLQRTLQTNMERAEKIQIGEDYQQQQKNLQSNTNLIIQQKQHQQDIQNVVKSTTGALSIMGATIGTIKAATNENLSAWDRFKATVMGIVNIVTLVARNLESFKSLGGSLKNLLPGKTAKDQAKATLELAGANKIDEQSEYADMKAKQANANASVDATKKIGSQITKTLGKAGKTATKTGAEISKSTKSITSNLESVGTTAAGTGATVSAAGAATAEGGAAAAGGMEAMGAGAGAAGASLGALAAAAAVAIVVIAALVAFIAWNVKEYNKDAEAAEKAAKAAEELRSQNAELKESFDQLKNAWETYEAAKEKLDSLTKGTKEWKEALKEANDAALEVIKNVRGIDADTLKNLYHRDQNTGELVIDQKTMEQVLEKQEANVRASDLAVASAELQSLQASNSARLVSQTRKADFKQGGYGGAGVVGVLGSGMTGPGAGLYTAWKMHDNASVEAKDVIIKNLDLFEEASTLEEFEKKLQDLGIETDKLSNDYLLELQQSVESMATESAAAAEKLKLIASLKVDEELGDDYDAAEKAVATQAVTDAQNKIYNKIMRKQADEMSKASKAGNKYYQELAARYEKATGGKYRAATGNTVQGTDKNRTLIFEDTATGKKTEGISISSVANTIAAYEALEQAGVAADKARENFQNLETNLKEKFGQEVGQELTDSIKQFIVDGNLDALTEEQFNLLQGLSQEDLMKMFGVDNLFDLNEALGGGKKFASWKKYQKALEDYETALEDFIDKLNINVQNAYNSLTNTEGLDLNSKKKIAQSLQDAFLYGGEESVKALTDFYQSLSEEDFKEFAKATAGITDWGKITVTDLEKTLKDAGIETEFTNEQLSQYIKVMRDASDATADFTSLASKYAEVMKIAANLKTGDTISAEDYNKLGSAADGYFTRMLDGTYKLTKDASDFYDAIKSNQVELFRDTLETEKKDLETLKAARAQNFDINALSKNQRGVGELGQLIEKQKNSPFITVADSMIMRDLQATRDRENQRADEMGLTQEQRKEQGLDWQNNEGIEQQLALLKLIGDRKQAAQWEDEYLKTGTVDTEALAKAVGDLSEKYGGLDQAIEAASATYREDWLALLTSASDLDELNSLTDFTDPDSVAAYVEAYDQLREAQRMEDIDVDEMEGYAEHLRAISKDSKELSKDLKDNEEGSEDLAIQIMRMSKGVKTLGENWDDWSDILKHSSKESEEYYQAMDDTRSAMSDLLDIDKEFISEDFITDNFKDIEKAANGDADAIDRLRKAALQDIVLNMELADGALQGEELWTEIQSLQTMLDAMGPLKAGAIIDTSGLDAGEAEFIDKLNEIILASGMSASQVNAMLAGMGFQANFAKEPQKVQIKDPDEVTTHHSIQNKQVTTMEDGSTAVEWDDVTTTTTKPGKVHEGEIDAYSLETSEPGTTVVPKIDSVEKMAGGSFNNYSSKNKGGGKPSGGKGGGGSKSKAKKIEKTKDQSDRYHKVNTQIEKTSNQLDMLGKAEEKALGGDWVKNLTQQFQLLNNQIANYNEKLRIANGEQDELKKKLAEQGVTFNADGTISNYNAAFDAQLAKLNALEDQYNNLSEAQKEKWDDDKVIDKAKEDFSKFKENMDRYDELVSSFIPDLQKQIQDAIDQIVEKQIKKFNKGIDLRLDMADAERDWNKFKTKVIDGIDEDDIIGQTQARIRDFATYYDKNTTGSIQSLTNHINDIVEEMNKIISNVYGEDDAKKIEDLKKYYEELMDEMEGVFDLQKEIHENYLDMMDEVQDKFDKQIEAYETITDLIDHDMNVIQLIYGEKAYKELSQYYKQQKENYLLQLDLLRREKELWQEQYETAASPEEKEKAKEHLIQVIKELNDLTETALETFQDDFLNSAEEIFATLNDQVTQNKGLDYIDTEWQLINKEADQYLDTINQLFETQALENKYLDAIDQTDNIAAQRKLKDLMDEELTALKEKDKLTKYDIERANKRYEIALKQIALEEAQQNKSTMRLRRDSQGNYRYEYVADNDAIDQAKDELEKLKNDLYNFDKEQYQESLSEMYDIWVEWQEALKEAAQMNDPEEQAAKEKLINETYGNMINNMLAKNVVIRGNLQESAFEDLALLYDKDLENYTNMTNAEKDALMNDLVPTWDSGVQEMINDMIADGGFYPVVSEALAQLKDIEDELAEGYTKIGKAGGQSFGDIRAGIDETIDFTQSLIEDNETLTNKYKGNLETMRNLTTQIDELADSFKDAGNEATNVIQQVQELLKKTEEKNAKEYEAAAKAATTDKTVTNAINGNSTTTTTSAPTTTTTNNTSTATQSNPYSGYRLGGQTYTIQKGDTLSGIAKRFYKNASLYTEIWNHNKGHLRGSNANQIWPGEILYLNTGGYTGDWSGNNGRVAMLHQKELVLNATDTENMLNAINVMRNLTNSVGIATLARLASLGAGGSAGVGGNGLEQNVHISATFPNATSSREIEEALLNLTNRASQMVGRR